VLRREVNRQVALRIGLRGATRVRSQHRRHHVVAAQVAFESKGLKLGFHFIGSRLMKPGGFKHVSTAFNLYGPDHVCGGLVDEREVQRE
jgi:hypothetical protein